MRKRNSTPPTPQSKPERPEGSPLFWHASGRWAKKIRGRFVYFGRGSHDDAVAEYQKQADDLHSGKSPREEPAGLTVYRLCYKFLDKKKKRTDTGELSPHTLRDYAAVCQRLIRAFGKHRLVADLRQQDFARLRESMAKKWGPVRLGNEIIKTRVVFKYAVKGLSVDDGRLDKEVDYGDEFSGPTKKTLRKHRAARGPRMFEADEIRRLIDAAAQPLKTMLLLGVNAGFGNSDVGTVPLSTVDLKGGWLSYARPKTGIARRCPLWPETVRAIKEWLPSRPKSQSEADAGLLFVTAKGNSWAKDTSDNPVSKETRKLLDELGINGGRNFYCLRHTFQTMADESRDFPAVRSIMGHTPGQDIADVYRERISDDRLRAVTEHVRGWLFSSARARGEEAGGQGGGTETVHRVE